MENKCLTVEDVLKIQHDLIRGLCIWDWLAENDMDAARLAIYIQGVSDMATMLIEKLEVDHEQ